MEFFLKNTQTSIGSWISNITSIITRNKPKGQELSRIKNLELRIKLFKRFIFIALFFITLVTNLFILTALFSSPTFAIVDPLAVPNNRFGIHIIQATQDESSPAAQLVNTNGDWGYITVLVESKDRNHEKWQEFFNDLRRRHLIPLVRLATQPEGNYWKRPHEGEEQAWADFLDALNWPTKNRYVIIYNEPNHAKEWGNKVDAKSYAETLDKTITALKNKNNDFFVLNGGFDASAPSEPPAYEEELTFITQMNEAVPGIFNKLDGWVSHSYPNPGFIGSPAGHGRGTVRTFLWETSQLKKMGVDKTLPVFITETGWKHAEGLSFDYSLPDADMVTKYYEQVFENAWNNASLVAVTPFLLNYQEIPFDHFSFKQISNRKHLLQFVGLDGQEPGPQYYPMFQAIKDLPKTSGQPVRDTKAELTQGEIYSSIVTGETYNILLTFKNTGQSIWNDSQEIRLVPISGGAELGITSVNVPQDVKIEPGQEHTFNLTLKAPQSGVYNVSLNLFKGDKQFDTPPVQFTTQVKSPVILRIMGALGWKKDFEGLYVLKVKGVNGISAQSVTLSKEGVSDEVEARYLLPDYTFEFSLEKPYYRSKTIKQQVHTGVNTLNFGVLQPDIFSAVFNPPQLWKMLPYSN